MSPDDREMIVAAIDMAEGEATAASAVSAAAKAALSAGFCVLGEVDEITWH